MWQGHFNLLQSLFVKAFNDETIVVKSYTCSLLWKTTCDFQHETGNGLRFALLPFEFRFILDFYYPVKILERGLSFENKIEIVQFGEYQVFIVEFVADVAHYFLNNVLKGNYARCSPVLVNHNRQMVFLLLELQQQVIEFFVLGHEIGFTDKIHPI